MSEHKHGEMEIQEQEKTFDGFIRFTAWSVVAIIVFIVFLGLFNG